MDGSGRQKRRVRYKKRRGLYKKRIRGKKLHVCAGCSLWGPGGFYCSLEAFLSQQNWILFLFVQFLDFLVIKTWDPDPDSPKSLDSDPYLDSGSVTLKYYLQIYSGQSNVAAV
jgi:hypothetical protein